ncbi:MAG: hypothetical protein LC733_04410, partial [Actinobacteria bacterium]|nr:hypothetical protein [Actinomycetota bacterium]
AAPVLIGQFVESGETLDEVVLLPVGPRDPDTLAYRVQFLVKVKDAFMDDTPFSWNAVAFVPVALVGPGEGADASVGELRTALESQQSKERSGRGRTRSDHSP